jgi:glyoxylase-like metal-dependent hydrolase (beta-lactamase superfamily II)
MRAQEIADGVYRLRTLMVNVYFVRAAAPPMWALVDAGMPGFARSIRAEAERIFGTRPASIFLTHGHFDHVGALPWLADEWGVPVYAHPLELPYLTGRSPYPPPDPTVGGGTQSWLSPLFPRGPIDLGSRIHMLPTGGDVPGMPEWRWICTDGHAPGHVSFFRDRDRTLIAGDAVATTRQESTRDVLLQRRIVSPPPAFYTCDWIAARRSVAGLAALEPNLLAAGHGHPLHGAAMREALRSLADNFDRAMPSSGRYIPYPAVTDERGVVHVPPRAGVAVNRPAVIAAAAAAAVGVLLASQAYSRRRAAHVHG